VDRGIKYGINKKDQIKNQKKRINLGDQKWDQPKQGDQIWDQKKDQIKRPKKGDQIWDQF
jgi:hypothetical protein